MIATNSSWRNILLKPVLYTCTAQYLGDGAVSVGVHLGEELLGLAQVARGAQHLVHGAHHSEIASR